MRRRRRMSKRRSKRQFRAKARVHPKNKLRNRPMRGGIRL